MRLVELIDKVSPLLDDEDYDSIRMSPQTVEQICEDDYAERLLAYQDTLWHNPLILVSPPVKRDWRSIKSILGLKLILDEQVSEFKLEKSILV